MVEQFCVHQWDKEYEFQLGHQIQRLRIVCAVFVLCLLKLPIFVSLTFGNLFLKYSNPRLVLSIPFTKFFMRPSLCTKGADKFSQEEQEED